MSEKIAELEIQIVDNATGAAESIITRGVKQWLGHLPEMHKVPTIFLLYK